ncbi:MAG TPA: hypothetical protein ENK11_09640, partial [Phycisphaerales bacterium]|nr:hypothetical protein [Phycisphaerales bacterium]
MAVTMCAAVSSPAFGQTSAFTYQGSLTEMSGKADGLYDFLFSLYDGETGNGLLGQSELTNVQVSGGLFDVELDFGADVFDTDADRFLEIRVRPSGQQTYETLTPRVKITSAPTAVVAKRAGFASTAGYAQNGPFEPLDTTPPADCGARPGEYQVITQLDTPHGSFQGVDVAYPVKLERIYTFLPTTGDVLVGDFTNVTIRVSRLYDPASNWYNTVFQQGDTGLTLTIQ